MQWVYINIYFFWYGCAFIDYFVVIELLNYFWFILFLRK